MKIFKSALFWILFSSFLLSVGLFFLAPLMKVNAMGPRLLLSAVPLILGIIIALIVKLLQMGKALKSGDSPSKPANKNPFDAALAVQPWIDALRKETDEALEILKTTGKGKAGVGQNPLDVFRFYLMLGGAQSGKTSLLENSGVNFPRRFPGAADLARQNKTFTQWWMSSLGIFLETPHRYVTGEEGDEEFTAFLKLLDSEGKKTALDGLLLTVSLREMVQAGDRLNDLAARYRDRIALVQSTLRLELPVYIAFTYSDMLPGFSDFFANLRDPDSQQVFGATFALKGNLGPARQRFEREFKKIWDNLHARTPYRLAQVNDPGQKQRIFAFANEFGAAQERLGTFIEHLFKDTLNRERPMFRGFFMTSITPTGDSGIAPVNDPFAGQAAPSFHPLDPRAKQARQAQYAVNQPAAPAYRSLFVHLLFSGVLKNDLSLARFPGYRLGSVSRRSLLAGGAMAAIAVLLLAWGIGGYFASTSRLHELGNLTVAAGQLTFRQPAEFSREFAVLDSLLGRIRELEAGGEDGWLVPPGYGHHGEAIRLASRVHQAQLDRLIARPAMRAMGASLEVSASNYFASQHGPMHEQLKMYLLLSPLGKSHLDEVNPDEFGTQLSAFWAPELGNRVGIENLPPDFEATLEDHARFLAEQLVKGRRGPVDRADDRIVAETRKALLGTPSIEGLFSAIVGSVEASKDLTLQDMGVPADAMLKSGSRVRGIFTKTVFDEDAMERLADGAEQPHRKDWVLGENVTMALPPEMQDQNQLYRALVDRYYQEYAAEWMNFLRSLSVRVPPEPALAAGKLSGYASSTQGLPAVLARVMTEVNLIAPSSQAQSAAEKSKFGTGKVGKLAKLVMQNRDADKRKLKEQFRFVEELAGANGGVLQDYLTAVKGLSEVLSRISLSGDAAGETMLAAQQLFQGKTESPLNFCWNESNKVKARYEGQSWLFPLLENPVRDVASYLADAVGKQLEAYYQQRVISFYNQNLRGKYPMIKLGPQEANLDDLKSFFNPENGVFATFVSGKLQPFVKEGDDGYTVRAWNGVRLPFNGNALQAIFRTQQVQKRLYTDNPPSMRIYTVNLTLPEVRNTARITFRLGEDRLSVKPGEGQARATLRWPNENTYKGAEILVENVGGGSQGRRIDGSWGLMKLLDGSRALNQRPGGFSAKWRFNVAQKYDVDVLLDANLTERDNPFSTPDFFKFELPGTLLDASSAYSP